MKLIDEGREPHPAFYQQPEILPWNKFYWDAFHDLSTERQIGMGLGPIPRSHIMAYAAEHDILGDNADHFADIIRRVDIEYLRQTSVSSKDKKKLIDEVSVNDPVGMGQVMDRLRARAASATKQHVKPKGTNKPDG